MSSRPEINSMLKQVEGWSVEDRRELAAELMQPLESGSVPTVCDSNTSARRSSLGALIGIANPQGRSFTDAEVDALRFQALREAHGL